VLIIWECETSQTATLEDRINSFLSHKLGCRRSPPALRDHRAATKPSTNG
jgi:G:T-mismatch repair DNA endonuclease (very short patch repair protein)